MLTPIDTAKKMANFPINDVPTDGIDPLEASSSLGIGMQKCRSYMNSVM